MDLIATRTQGAANAKTVLIDVKYYNQDNRTHGKLSDVQRRAGVVILLVEGDGNCKFLDGKEEDDENII